jgi:hypothetical protein
MSTHKPNIKLAHHQRPLGEGELNMGMREPIHIPDEAAQKAGWFEPRAAEIIQQYPRRFKIVVQKGS